MHRADSPHVVAVCGSLRANSRTRIVLRTVLAAAREAGADTSLIDLRERDIPSRYAVAEPGSDVEGLRREIAAADGLVLGTPNYHGSYSGALKDALDHCQRDTVEGTTVGLVEVAAGAFPGSALRHLRTVCRTLHAWSLPTEVAVPNAHEQVTTDGIEDEAVAERSRRLGRRVARYAGVAAFPLSDVAPEGERTAGEGRP